MIRQKEKRRVSPGASAADLIKKATRHPGVAEILKVYGECQEVMDASSPFMSVVEGQQIVLASTSSN